MQYFDRHEHMSSTTRKTILEIINDLHQINENTFMFQNSFYGLFDGFDYSPKIIKDPLMDSIFTQNIDLFNKIQNVCKDIATYPKSKIHNTQV